MSAEETPRGAKGLRREPWPTVALLTVASASLAFAAFGGWWHELSRHQRTLVHGLLLGVAVALYLWHGLRWSSIRRTMYRRPPRGDTNEGWDSESLISAVRRLTEMTREEVDDSEARRIKDFVRISNMPSLGRARIVESVELQENHIVKTVRAEYRLDSIEDVDNGYFYVPLLRPSKGQLLNNFELRDNSGASMMTLPYGETVRLLTRAIHLLSQASLEALNLSNESAAQAELDYLSRAILPPGNGQSVTPHRSGPSSRLVTREPDPSETSARDLPEGSQMASSTAAAGAETGTSLPKDQVRSARPEVTAEFLEKFVSQLQGVYPIVAIVPAELIVSSADHRFVLLEYSYTVPVTRRIATSEGASDRLKSVLRTITMTPGAQVVVDASKSLRSESYHLRVSSPPGYHVGDLLFVDKQTGEQVRRATTPGLAFSQSHYRCLPARGQPFAHLYTRAFTSNDAQEPRLIVRYYENLPGSLGKATVLACVTFLVVWLVAVGSPTKPDDSDALALVLAFPALVAAWLRFDDRGQVLGTSLLARLSLISSVSLTMGSAFLYLAQTAGRFGRTYENFHLLFVYNPYWMTLVGCAMMTAVVVSMGIVIRVARTKRLHRSRKDFKEP